MDLAKYAHFASPISPSRWEAFGKHFNIETSKDDMKGCALTWQGWLSATDGEEQPWTGRPEPPPDISRKEWAMPKIWSNSTILYYYRCISYGPNLNQYQSYQSSNVRQDPRHPEPAVASLSIFQVSQFLPSSIIYRECIIPPRKVAEKPWWEVPGRVDCWASVQAKAGNRTFWILIGLLPYWTSFESNQVWRLTSSE